MTAPVRAPSRAEVAARLRASIARLNRQLRQQSVGDLTLSQWSALVTIETAGSLRLGDLAEREHVSAPTATRLAASLEDRGLLRRDVDVADRRSALLSLTAAGREALQDARRARTALLARRLSGWPADDVRRLADALPLLEQLADPD